MYNKIIYFGIVIGIEYIRGGVRVLDFIIENVLIILVVVVIAVFIILRIIGSSPKNSRDEIESLKRSVEELEKDK